ncbi:MAG: hypothetical protein Kow0068_13440 [Marinilabiliales bacterium]
MENFNKNWLIILLTAVVFGLLGYLLGSVHHGDHFINHKCHKFHNYQDYDDFEKEINVDVSEIIEDAVENGDSGKVVIVKKIIK